MSLPSTPVPNHPRGFAGVLPPPPELPLLPFNRPSPLRTPNDAPSPSPLPSPAAPAVHQHDFQGDAIKLTQLYLDDDDDLVFVFDTERAMFGLVLPLSDRLDLSWKETQAIVDATRLCIPGHRMRHEDFTANLRSLELKYGSTKGPIMQEDNRLCAAFYPVRGTIADEGHQHMLVSTMLRLDVADRRIVVLSHTAADTVYSIRIGLKGQHGKMAEIECNAFIDVLTMLEPGDIVAEETFRKFARVLEKRYGRCSITPVQQADLSMINIDVFPAYRKRSRHDRHQQQHPGASPRRATAAPSPATPYTPRPREPSPPSPGGSSVSIETIPMSPGGSRLMHPPRYKGFSYVRLLADSGQAQVFEGIRDSDGLRVAIKVFRLDPSQEHNDAYKTELRLLLKMTEHRNIVSVVDFFETPTPALITKYINGTELGEYVQRNGALEQKDGIALAIGIAKGLRHLHNHGIVHRDLKSANVLITSSEGQLIPIIIDLGLSSVLPETDLCAAQLSKAQVTKEVKGTPLWMAPEMILRRQWSGKTDVYAFAILLWEMFSGQPPYVKELPPETTHMELLFKVSNGIRPSLDLIESRVDQHTLNLIEECWAEDPKDRPAIRRVLDCLIGDDPKTIFERHDINKDGHLEYTEFVIFLQFYATERYTPRQISMLFEIIDEDGSGDITYDEFERFWNQVEIAGIDSVINRRSLKVVSGSYGNSGLSQDQLQEFHRQQQHQQRRRQHQQQQHQQNQQQTQQQQQQQQQQRSQLQPQQPPPPSSSSPPSTVRDREERPQSHQKSNYLERRPRSGGNNLQHYVSILRDL